ncbi:Uncharacterised protein [Schaalia odontolytica]|uniref:Uncharacterized protein n=1 Tax=Schaalia odontolytica TaxID=1660 RepID=A0A2X0U5D6_9ACTO|nr:Uncharacterised protein [Schaalia odontolytica]
MGSTCGLAAAPAAWSAEEMASCAFVVISRAMKSLLNMFVSGGTEPLDAF